jgi:hypothetical protein
MAEYPSGKLPARKTMENSIKYVIIILVSGLVFLLFFLVRDYRILQREQRISARELWLAAVVRNHGHLTANDAAVVRSWMTFDYINHLFGMPAEYMSIQLGIVDPRYPKFLLSDYAKSEHVSSTVVVGEVEDAIQNYFTQLKITI